MQSGSLEYYQTHNCDLIGAVLSGNIHPGFKFTINKIRDVIQCYLSPDQRRVIDLGCGPGYLLWELQRNGFQCLGIDFNPDMIRVAREHFHVNAEVRTVEDLISYNSKFDLALLLHVLEHVEDPMNLLRNIRQILSPNGVLVVDVPNPNYSRLRYIRLKSGLSPGDYPPHHLTFWSTRAISNALEISDYSVLYCRARPYPEAYQTEHSLIHRFNLPTGKGTACLARIFQSIGRLAGLQGATIFAVARRNR